MTRDGPRSPLSIYQPQIRDNVELALPLREGDFEVVTTLAGTRHTTEWTPLPVEVVSVESGAQLEYSDFPYFGDHVLVLSDQARELLAPIVEDKGGELLPLACRARRLWLLNAYAVVDALDQDRSVVERFESGRIMRIEKLAFLADRLQGLNVFKMAQDERGPLYLRDAFVRAIEATPLVGYGFRLVWTNEAGPGPDVP